MKLQPHTRRPPPDLGPPKRYRGRKSGSVRGPYMSQLSHTSTIARRSRDLLVFTLLEQACFTFIYLVCIQILLLGAADAPGALAGLALSAYAISRIVAQPSSGMISDITGTRPILVCVIILELLAAIGFLAFAPSFHWVVVPLSVLYGLGAAMISPSVYSEGIARIDSNGRATFISLFGVALAAGTLIGLAGSPLEFVAGFAEGMLVALAALGATLLAASGIQSSQATQQFQGHWGLAGLISRVRTRARLAFVVCEIAFGAASGAAAASYGSLGPQLFGVSSTAFLVLLAPAGVAAAVGLWFGAAGTDRLSPGLFLVGGLGLLAICLAMLSFVTNAAWALPILVIGGAAFGIAYPGIGATRMGLADTSARGALVGTFLSWNGFGLAVGSALGGLVLSTGGIAAVLWLLSGLCCASAIFGNAAQSGLAVRVPSGRASPNSD